MVGFGDINQWQPPNGAVTTWMASPAGRAAAQSARRGDVPASYQQIQHLWTAYEGSAMGLRQPRLMVVAWEIAGVCDLAAMTAAITTHVRRHDTYQNWFEFENDVIVRRTIEDPKLIEFVPTEFGNMRTDQIRRHALTMTPPTLEWDCFTFGVVQHVGYFTFYASVDHLHIDGMSAAVIFFDINLIYQELRQAAARQQPSTLPPAGSYHDYTVRQHEQVGSLTLSSPGIKGWIEFARDIEGVWPRFPLPLGSKGATGKGEFVTVELLDAAQTESFDTACRAAGARFSGGVLACAALAERQLTGTETYHVFTPYDTRRPGVDSMSVGWFASLFPVTVPTGDGSFGAAARAAQKSFDDSKHLASVPMDRVMELATPSQLGIRPLTRPAMMVSFLDFTKIPVAALFEQANFGTYGDDLSHGGVNMWINRQADKTTLTISFPETPKARKSVRRYITALTEAFAGAVKTTSDWVDAVEDHANTDHGTPVINL
ncbi:MAG TPA: condensation domain-containing protein [Mycobacterium sp.]|nr:condensation domain-containing protein [Mycobacterium sp.]HTX97530.1 condensation domain-containing protein [Mycobacterium sp.]